MKNDKAPGCFGFAITNDPSDKYCQQCIWFKPCCVSARQTLTKIHKEMDVGDMLAKHKLSTKPICRNRKERKASGRKKVKVMELDEEQSKLIDSLPKKTGQVVSQLIKKGIDLKVELASGINPFESARPKFMQTPCRLLLEGGFSDKTLSDSLDRDFMKWSILTRKSHEGIIMNVLRTLDIVDNDNGYYRLKK